MYGSAQQGSAEKMKIMQIGGYHNGNDYDPENLGSACGT